MLNKLWIYFAEYKLFWLFRDTCNRLIFYCYRLIFRIRYSVQERQTSTRSLLGLLVNTRSELVLAFLLAAVLQVSNPYFAKWISEYGFAVSADSEYGTLLAAVVGIGGIFIGLYYAAISSVGSTIYADVPNDIRELFAQERVGTSYMKFLAVVTYLGICLLALNSVGFEPVFAAVPLVVLSAGLAIIGFVLLGTRAFYLFDPTVLSAHLVETLQRCTRQMQAGGFRWTDIRFQEHAFRVASSSITTLKVITDLSADKPQLNGRPFSGMCKDLIAFLIRYETIRNKIPSDSHWFHQTFVHKEWYRTDETETSTAHETASMLRPQSISNTRWLENKLFQLIKRCIEVNVRKERYDIVIELLQHIDIYVQHLAADHQTEFAFELIGETNSLCYNLLFARDRHSSNNKDSLEVMAICGVLGGLSVSFMTTYVLHVESFRLEELSRKIRRIRWKNPSSLYKVGFPFHFVSQLEWLRKKLHLELKVERRLVTPHWYIKEMTAIKEMDNLHTSITSFFEKPTQFYREHIDTAISSDLIWSAAVLILKEFEYWKKLKYHLESLNTVWAEFESFRRLEDPPSPKINDELLSETLNRVEKELLLVMSNHNILLSQKSRPEDFPDFAGQFLHTVGEGLLSASIRNDSELVKEVYSRYFAGNHFQYEQLKPDLSNIDWRTEYRVTVAVAPLLDLMEISGYIILFAEYHESHCMKSSVIKTWDKYLEDNTTESLTFLSTALSITELAWGAGQRFSNRIRWKQIVGEYFQNDGRRSKLSSHTSPLIRVLSKGLRFSNPLIPNVPNGIEVFIGTYIRKRDDTEGFNFVQRWHRDIKADIDRATESSDDI